MSGIEIAAISIAAATLLYPILKDIVPPLKDTDLYRQLKKLLGSFRNRLASTSLKIYQRSLQGFLESFKKLLEGKNGDILRGMDIDRLIADHRRRAKVVRVRAMDGENVRN